LLYFFGFSKNVITCTHYGRVDQNTDYPFLAIQTTNAFGKGEAKGS